MQVGPILGALLATTFYKLIKVLEHETVNMETEETESVGQYNLATRTEKLITQDGRTIDVDARGETGEKVSDRTLSGGSDRTEVIYSQVDHAELDLGAQRWIRLSGND